MFVPHPVRGTRKFNKPRISNAGLLIFNKIPFKVIGVLAEKGENAFGQDQDDIIILLFMGLCGLEELKKLN